MAEVITVVVLEKTPLTRAGPTSMGERLEVARSTAAVDPEDLVLASRAEPAQIFEQPRGAELSSRGPLASPSSSVRSEPSRALRASSTAAQLVGKLARARRG